MKWSPQQDLALRAIRKWLQDPKEQVFYLAGYAGVGKTTLAREIASGVSGLVCFCAFTGKAAHVLRQKGCEDASTIHSLIYITHDGDPLEEKKLIDELDKLEPRLKLWKEDKSEDPIDKQVAKNQIARIEADIVRIKARLKDLKTNKPKQPMFRLNPLSRARDAKLIIVDECSMLDDRMWKDLCSFGVKILVQGDPAQLPPVGGPGPFTTRTPDFLLTEIHRQAKESPILVIATMAREGKNIPIGDYGNGCRVIRNQPDIAERVLQADQVLVGKNATRHASNLRYRELLRARGTLAPGGPYPQAGDKLVCLRNNHEHGLLNGSLWKVSDSIIDLDDDTVTMTVSSLEDFGIIDLCVTAHLQHFDGREIAFFDRRDAEEFTHGYALTVHKSQGSQWDDVVLFDESFVFRENRHKWLYTGITRAAKNLTVVRV